MFIPHHVTVAAGDPAPARWMLVLHGIYGSGANWRTFARKLTARRPDWGAVLVDLRMHGQSRPAPPPHTVAAAAGDLVNLAEKLASEDRPVRAVCGHSFGGKVALAYRARAAGDLLQTWVLDASPSAQPGALRQPDNVVAQVLGVLGELPQRFAGRDQFVDFVTERGFPAALGHWLAMNLERRGDGFVFALDPGAMAALLTDYYELDCWPAVWAGPGDLHAVIAGKSSAVSRADRARLEALAQSRPGVHVSCVEESGHWLHIEAPEALLDIVAAGLPA